MSQESARDEARRVALAAAGESCAAMLGELGALLRRFVVMTPAQAHTAALWIVHTWTLDAAQATPYLAVTSAEKRSGKTRLLEVLELLVARPWFTGRTTAAVLPRKIDAVTPTLLLDESDAAFGGDKEYAEALRGVLNTGHRRGGRATVCVGQGANISFKDFSTFCPKAIAGIGKLPDTVADRAVPIRLERRAPGERVDRFRRRDVEPQAQQLHARLRACADVAREFLEDARPALPVELDDRAWDGVEPLLAIADLAGGDWPVTARAACVELYAGRQIEDESFGIQLLTDIRRTLDRESERDENPDDPPPTPLDRITTVALLDRLNDLDESPWADWWGKSLSTQGLAKLLARYGVKSRSIKFEPGESDKTRKGFLREQFESAWARYLPREGGTPGTTRIPLRKNDESDGGTDAFGATREIPRNPALRAGSAGVPPNDPPEGGTGASGCTCQRPARSPRADGPDVCRTCKQPILGADR